MNVKFNPTTARIAGPAWQPRQVPEPRADATLASDLATPHPAAQSAPTGTLVPVAADDSPLPANFLFQPLMRGLGDWARGISGAGASAADRSSGAQANGSRALPRSGRQPSLLQEGV